MEREYYNGKRKGEFIDSLIVQDKSYAHTYGRLFEITCPYEKLHGKDLADFTSKDILVVFKTIASKCKYTTVLSYNSLIKSYKEWAKNSGFFGMNDEVCTVDELKTIKNYKKYVIFNDDDLLNITQYLDIDGGDWNIALFLKLFWEIDGQEDLKDVLAIKVEDLNVGNRTLAIYNTRYNRKNVYNISGWLADALDEYSELSNLEYERGKKRGSYAIKTAVENNGYIFRMTYTSRTKVGEPLDGVKFSNTLYQFCQRNQIEVITINDIQMSLALRNMVKSKKTPAEMYTERRYFANLPSSVYGNVFKEFANEKHPIDYIKYVEYYHKVINKI